MLIISNVKYEDCLKSFESQHENDIIHQNPFWYYNRTFCKISLQDTVKIVVVILDAQLLFESFVPIDVSVFI